MWGISLRRAALVALGVLALVLLIERLVVTDAEAIESMMEGAAEALDAGDFDRLGSFLHESFASQGQDRETVLAYIRRLHAGYRPTGLNARMEGVVVEGDGATGVGHVGMQVLGRPHRVRLRMTFLRGPDGWQMASAEPIDYQPY